MITARQAWMDSHPHVAPGYVANQEILRLETFVNQAIRDKLSQVVYKAKFIGDPPLLAKAVDGSLEYNALTPVQKEFYDELYVLGYDVIVDGTTWIIDWSGWRKNALSVV